MLLGNTIDHRQLPLPSTSGEMHHQLAVVDEGFPKNRMNDGKCDTRGRLWCGTMGYEKSPGEPVSSEGSLFCYDGGTCSS